MKEIVVTDTAILKAPCSEVDESEFAFLREKLQTSLEEHNIMHPEQNGVGLAAPQIGINKKACYIHSETLNMFLFNPVVVDAYDFNQIKEGCLSVPRRQISVERFKYLFVKASNYPDGIILSGMNAIIAQHEIDHLNGVLITDHLQTLVNEHKMNRNAPCHCGSGRKFKRCCIHN